jgi:hypothetical protein
MQSTLESLVDEIDMMNGDLEGLEKVDRMLKMKELIEENELTNDFAAMSVQWSAASKMRIWLMEKKKNLSIKIEKAQNEKFVDHIKKEKIKAKKAAAEIKEAETKAEVKEE